MIRIWVAIITLWVLIGALGVLTLRFSQSMDNRFAVFDSYIKEVSKFHLKIVDTLVVHYEDYHGIKIPIQKILPPIQDFEVIHEKED